MSLKTKENQIKELSEHILGFQESVKNHLSLIKQLNELKGQTASLFKGSDEIKDCAYKLKGEIDRLNGDILQTTADSTKVTRLYHPDLKETSDELFHLTRKTEKFVNLILSEMNKQEQVARA